MSFLLAKISILLLLSAGLGALLAYWWLRRHYEDVTTEYTRLSDETKRWREGLEDRLEQRLVQRLGVELAPLMGSLQSVQAAGHGIELPPPVAPDLSPLLTTLLAPLHKRLDEVQAAVSTIHTAAPKDVDLTPVLQRLGGIEDRLQETHRRMDELASSAQQPPPVVVQPPALPPSATVRPGSTNLLMQASYGRADNLRLIKGVASVLEKMLHGIGVYYFWQIADWTPEDIAHADAQLSAFKGRILRDDWKRQASRLALAPDAARKPEGF